MNLSCYETGSSLMASGLTYWQAIIAIITGNGLAAFFAVLNSVSGADSHLGYPIVCRSVWGMWGSYFPILNRILLSLVWYGVQAVLGGDMIYVCLRSIWLDIDERIPNTLPAGIGITSANFVGYFVPYFHVASCVVAITLFVLLGWAVGTSEGWGEVITAKTSISRSELGWTMSAGIMSFIGSIAARILNQNDFTRWAKRPRDVTYSQAFSYTFSGNITAIVGVLVTAATQKQYGHGTALWNPTDLFIAIQDQHGSRDRAAAFFLGTMFIVSQLSINVVGNVMAGGLDVAAVLPKYVNLRRGAYIIAVLSVLPNPWQQLASGSTFLTVLSAYSVFLGPMVGLLCVHYYIIQKRQFHYPDIYEGSHKSIYWYTWGVNWRTVVAWIVGVVPSMPGFVNRANPALKVGLSATRIYDISFVLGFVLFHYPSITPLERELETRDLDKWDENARSTAVPGGIEAQGKQAARIAVQADVQA
ncbi:hypothetical protein EJ03DRAFT_341272 [Teratosphaeria nubilosa]|uniref:Allantoin permease n=1 Tax=Teratosphaeria nubilosa TaxID=161662 RepID=A0A6G1LJA4_9PEZI|nr:hypothetical protein EJ03DRAFT_341272 [Teratosphaeria nubilosa]